MTQQQQYKAGAYFQFVQKSWECPTATLATHTEPLTALHECIQLTRAFAVKNLVVGQSLNVRFVVFIADPQPLQKWYGYDGQICLNWLRAKNRSDDQLHLFIGEKFTFTTCDVPSPDAPKHFIGLGVDGVTWSDRN